MEINNSITAILLAAGKGTRMKSPPTKNKVAYELANKPIIRYTYETLKTAGIGNVIVVVGYASESVRAALGNEVTYAVQDPPMGTGHAVQVALPYLPAECTTVLSMYGDDSAFYPVSLIQTLLNEHEAGRAALSVVTLDKKDPTGLGRIKRDNNGKVLAIVEEKNASEAERKITEINTGFYCFERDFLTKAIASLKPNQVSGEYYLTDVVAYAVEHHYSVKAVKWPSENIWFGVNTPEQLRDAELLMKKNNSALPA